MIKRLYIIVICSIIALPIYAQKPNTDKTVVQQEWGVNKFSSDKTLMENISDVEELKDMLVVFTKGDLATLSESEENLTIFLPMDVALENMRRKERKAFLEKTPKRELLEMWKEYIVPGRIDEHSIKSNIANKNGASVFVRTLGNNQLEFKLKNGEVYIKDAEGHEAKWIKGNFYYSNGFFHFIDGLLNYNPQ